MSSNTVGPDDYFVDPNSDAIEAGIVSDSIDTDMSPDDVASLINLAVEESQNWREEHLDDFQSKAIEYYRGEPFGNEEEDRSQIVVTAVRDGIRQTLPSLLRVFFGSEHVVEFEPRTAEDVDLAAQQTEVVNYYVREDNPGFLNFHAWFKDALLLRLGAVKWWWEETTTGHVESYLGLTLDELAAVLDEKSGEAGTLVEPFSELVGINEEGQDIYNVDLDIRHIDGRPRFAALPPEEVVWSPNARTVEDARMVGHVRDIPGDELIAMGVDPDIVEMKQGDVEQIHMGDIRAERRWDKGESHIHEDEQDETTIDVQFAEIYMRVDLNGDGIAELRKFDCVGLDYEVVNGDGYGEPVDEIPMAFLCPDPEPHAFVGLSQADATMDLQRIKSFVTRAMLDSLANSIDPVTEVVQSEVNMNDVLSRKLSRIVRTKKPGMIREVDHRWLGSDALGALQYLDKVQEDQLGISRASAGLDADALQSTTASAVNATVQGAQQQLEMIARIFAETGVRDLYRGILRLIVKHAPETRRRVVRLRGSFVEIDPSRWDATLDVRVNVAVGTGLVEQKLGVLMGVLQQQQALMEAQSPIVSWRGMRTTLQKIVELSGWPNADDFFEPFGPQEQMQLEQQKAQQAQEPSPTEMLMQLEREKLAAEAQQKAVEHALKVRDMELEDDRERDKIARDFAIKGEELRAKYAVEVDKAQLNAAVQRDRVLLDADLKRKEADAKRAAEAGEEIEVAPDDKEPGALGLPPVPQSGAMFGSGISPKDLEG